MWVAKQDNLVVICSFWYHCACEKVLLEVTWSILVRALDVTCLLAGLGFPFLFRSKGQMEATFLHHEGFLGALGALVSYTDLDIKDTQIVRENLKEQVS